MIILGIVAAGSGKLAFSPSMGIGAVAVSAFCSGFLGLLLFYRGLKFISFRDANLIRALNPVFVRVLITLFPDSNDASVYTRRRIDYPVDCLDVFAGEKTPSDWEGKLTVRPLFLLGFSENQR